MRQQFRDTALRLAGMDDKLILLFGDISVYLFNDFSRQYPGRLLNIGICENTLISMAAGMSAAGFHPVVHTIAPFVTERSYEQVKLDLCYNRFGCTIVTCGSSFDYAWDGATHHCYTDLALMRMLPGMEVMQPGSKREFDILFSACYRNGNPTYIRIAADEHGLDLPVEFGRGVVVKETPGATVTVITAGPILKNVHTACSDLPVNVLYFPTIKPIDRDLLMRFADTKILVVHDAFGLFEAVNASCPAAAEYHGLPDDFCCHYGTLTDIRGLLGLDAAGIRQRAGAML
ncbi:MAG: putative 33.6 kDa protein in fasciation locus precursor [Syntrophorhabdus sp. PtaB.Bin184]|jgi:transketolase|nr:MAG: putative 33.6 kDa protein in fasciation locus precursor [Syntrophorhabdus sp. PtaB.Bin184]